MTFAILSQLLFSGLLESRLSILDRQCGLSILPSGSGVFASFSEPRGLILPTGLHSCPLPGSWLCPAFPSPALLMCRRVGCQRALPADRSEQLPLLSLLHRSPLPPPSCAQTPAFSSASPAHTACARSPALLCRKRLCMCCGGAACVGSAFRNHSPVSSVGQCLKVVFCVFPVLQLLLAGGES